MAITKTLAVVCVVAALACSVSAARGGAKGNGMPDVEFALKFISTPIDGINHAVAQSETLMTTLTATSVEFTDTSGSQGMKAMWLSSTGAQKVRRATPLFIDTHAACAWPRCCNRACHDQDNTWSEVGNITFPSGDAILFRSFGA